MALKMIREAHLASTLGKDELKALSIIKEATGKDTIASVLNEAFTPTADDFDAWMRVVVGEAQDRGINLNKRAEFMQLVMDVLENDPANPPFEIQEAIAKKLWADYKAAKDEVRINKMAAAREEEEQAEKARKLIASRYAQGPVALPQADEDEESGFEQAYKAAKGMEDEENEEWYDSHGNPSPNGAYDAGGHFHRERAMGNTRQQPKKYEDEEDSMSFLKDVINDRGEDRGEIDKGSFRSHLRGDDEFDEYDEDGDATFNPDEYSVDDEDVFTSDDEDRCSCDDEDDVDDEVVGEDDLDSEDMGPPDEEVDVDVKREEPEKAYSEEEAVKSFFRQAATAPRSMMTQAIKDIEGEGKKAWTSSNVPKNPHPQKSAAYRAWQRGMLAAAKEALGIQDKPKDPKAKAKKKK